MLVICCGVHHTGYCFRKARGPHGGPKKESPPGRTDLVLPGIEVDLDVAELGKKTESSFGTSKKPCVSRAAFSS
jgi:hypothetical protein